MKRRQLITLLGGAAVWPLTAVAQGNQHPVLGFLSTSPETAIQIRIAAFRKGLRESGYVQAQDITFDVRRYEEGSGVAAELVKEGVAAIYASGNVAARVAKAATDRIPIVFTIGGDPVRLGLVQSLNRPGGNATGVSLLNTALETKRLQLLAEVIPQVSTIAVLANPRSSTTDIKLKEMRAAADTLGRKLVVLKASRAGEIETAFQTVAQQRIGGLVIASDNFFSSQDEQLGILAERHRIPAIYANRDFAVAGGLMTYGSSITDADRNAGIYAGRILQGTKPADLPVLQAAKIDFVINLKVARNLGIDIPITLLGRADEVIE
jgi:putative ABC transport system substrate-binding protein